MTLDGHEAYLAQLLKKAKSGEPEAFGSLYEAYAPVIFRFLFAHLQNRMDAEDLTEEVFFRAWRSLPNYQEKGVPFIAFLFRIAHNALIDTYRSSGRTSPYEPNGLQDEAADSHQLDPAEETQARMERQEIRRRLEQLGEDYRTVLTLRFFGNLSPDETAQAMGKSSGAVRVLQHRALAALRKLLDPRD